MRQGQTPQVSITINAQIADLNRVRPHVANQSGPDQKSIAIEFAAGAVVVVKRAGLNCVTLLNKVLSKNIRDIDVLTPSIESIKAAVRVLLELRKISEIVLVTIVI